MPHIIYHPTPTDNPDDREGVIVALSFASLAEAQAISLTGEDGEPITLEVIEVARMPDGAAPGAYVIIKQGQAEVGDYVPGDSATAARNRLSDRRRRLRRLIRRTEEAPGFAAWSGSNKGPYRGRIVMLARAAADDDNLADDARYNLIESEAKLDPRDWYVRANKDSWDAALRNGGFYHTTAGGLASPQPSVTLDESIDSVKWLDAGAPAGPDRDD